MEVFATGGIRFLSPDSPNGFGGGSFFLVLVPPQRVWEGGWFFLSTGSPNGSGRHSFFLVLTRPTGLGGGWFFFKYWFAQRVSGVCFKYWFAQRV